MTPEQFRACVLFQVIEGETEATEVRALGEAAKRIKNSAPEVPGLRVPAAEAWEGLPMSSLWGPLPGISAKGEAQEHVQPWEWVPEEAPLEAVTAEQAGHMPTPCPAQTN